MENGEDKIDEHLDTIQKTVEVAAGKVAYHTKADRENIIQRTHTRQCEIT